MARRSIFELRKYNAKKKREKRIAKLITEVRNKMLERIAYRRLNYYRSRSKVLKHDFILQDVLDSDHTYFALNGDIIPTTSQENINFITVETRTTAHMNLNVIMKVRKEDESQLVRESLKRQAILISKLKDENNEIEQNASDNTPPYKGPKLEGPEVSPKVVKFKANESNDGDEVLSQRTYQQLSPSKMEPIFSPKEDYDVTDACLDDEKMSFGALVDKTVPILTKV